MSKLSLLLAMALVAPASADLAPKHASDLVALRVGDGVPCPYSPSLVTVDARMNADGTLGAWDGPPPGKALVVNRVRLSRPATPGSAVTLRLNAPLAVIIETVVADASGRAKLDVTLPTGFAVRPGNALCTDPGDADVFGYLATDK